MGYSKKASTTGEDLGESFDYPYELLIADSDTALFRAAKSIQEDYIIVTHISSGKEKEFRNKTSFGVRANNIIPLKDTDIKENKRVDEDGNPYKWLAWVNYDNSLKGVKECSLDDFIIDEKERLKPDIEDYIDTAVTQFDMYVGGLKQLNLAPKYLLGIGGEGNFRYELAETLPYKGKRKGKPILFEAVKDAILTKYKNKIEITDNKEVDDMLAVYGLENYKHFTKTGKWKYCLCYVDKDLNMVISPSINPDKKEDGVIIPSVLDCAKHYGKQLLCGDLAVDNVAGLPDLIESLREAYGVRKGKSLGDTTAINYLKSCTTVKEVFERVVEAYKSYYGTELFTFTDYKGKTYECDWLDRLQETAILVYMSPLKDPLEYDIRQTLDKLKVDYQ